LTTVRILVLKHPDFFCDLHPILSIAISFAAPTIP
jgi:hypothetical protein